MIPKTIHTIWVGDESRRPDNCIRTWAERNPDWTVNVWGNEELAHTDWINTDHMREMSKRELNGVADMMRWEILYRHGGFVVDADSICIRPLDDWLLEFEAFACWESELARPGLIAAGYFACAPKNAFVGQIILDIKAEASVVNDMAWKTVGPLRLTDSYRRYNYAGLSILPSHMFIPEHFTGAAYAGSGTVYARQAWGSTKQCYETLHTRRFDAGGRVIDDAAAASAADPADAPAGATVGAPPDIPALPSAPSDHPTPLRSALESRHAPYFVQRVQVSRELEGTPRIDAFARLCAGKRVLHMGCADWPITDPKSSLHLALEPHCVALDGFDVHAEALAGLAPHVSGRLLSQMDDVTEPYDLILVPEVMEHVADVASFLSQIDAIDAPTVVITVPDAYQCHSRHFDYVDGNETFVEVVHPDHNCWYTPYTLTNVISKYTDWNIQGIWFFNGISLMVIATKPVKAKQQGVERVA
ncbi:MAG: mannosyltransferase [Pseudomonadota bacterium]|nr:mannosyltransferase [Pseudomonadota bacterium]